ncbi:hypothetical protein FACS1894103_2050 [Campylobacterota bacterium]|nr:hypothetical protein FACS1894103_2050 [Campylobacterota bacterium]
MKYKDFYFGMQSVSLPLHFFSFLHGSKIEVVAVLIYTHGLAVSHISVKKMAEYLTIKKSQIYATLNELKRDGVIERVGHGWRVNARWKIKEHIEKQAEAKGFGVTDMIDDQIAELEKWKEELVKAPQPLDARGGYSVCGSKTEPKREIVAQSKSQGHGAKEIIPRKNSEEQTNQELARRLIIDDKEIEPFAKWYMAQSQTPIKKREAYEKTLTKKIKNRTFEHLELFVEKWRDHTAKQDREIVEADLEETRLALNNKLNGVYVKGNTKNIFQMISLSKSRDRWFLRFEAIEIYLSFAEANEILKLSTKDEAQSFINIKYNMKKEATMNTS